LGQSTAALNLWYIQHKYQHGTAKALIQRTKVYLVCINDLASQNRVDKEDMLVFFFGLPFQNVMDLMALVFPGSDINSSHKIQITKHSELEYNPAFLSHGSVS